jgi:outer membrane protein assembly factor BamB
MKKHMTLAMALTALLWSVGALTAAEDNNWPQFRGPGALGVSGNVNLPDKWSVTENVLWKQVVAGRGWSSPVAWGNQIFVTTVVTEGKAWVAKKGLYFGGERYKPPAGRHHWKVVCLNLDTGKVVWEKTAHSGIPKGSIHIKNSYASETPITDGERVYAYFGNQGLYCYTMDGKQVWKKEWPAYKTRYGWGLAASPVLHKGRLYIVNDNEEKSFLVALDAKTGKEAWRVDRYGEKSNWSTPYIWENKLRTEIITPGTRRNRSYDLKGKLLYEFGGNSSITIATPYAKFGLLYVTSGYVGDRKKPMFAIRPGAKGDISLESGEDKNEYVAWCQRRAGPYNPSTIIYGDLMYVLLDRGLVACYEARTGKHVYGPERIVSRGGAFTSSPWAYNGKVFFLDENGVTYVLQAGRKFKLLSPNRLNAKEDMCMATPAMAGDKLIIRTDARVYCFRKTGKSSDSKSQ